MNQEIDRVEKFNSLIVEYINAFNYLELNVGLCVRHLSGLEIEKANIKLAKLTFENKLEWFLELTNSEVDGDLYAWCKEAHEKRQERNMYMHGQWKCLPHLEECVEFYVAPWVKEKYENFYPGVRFSLNKLEEIVENLQICLKNLSVLRKKYGI